MSVSPDDWWKAKYVVQWILHITKWWKWWRSVEASAAPNRKAKTTNLWKILANQRPTSLFNYIQFYGDGFGRDVIAADSPKIEGIEGNRPLRAKEIRRNPATIALVKFFVYVIAGSNGFERVGPKSGLPLFTIPHFLDNFFQIFGPHSADSPFQTYRTHTQKSGLIFRYIE